MNEILNTRLALRAKIVEHELKSDKQLSSNQNYTLKVNIQLKTKLKLEWDKQIQKAISELPTNPRERLVIFGNKLKRISELSQAIQRIEGEQSSQKMKLSVLIDKIKIKSNQLNNLEFKQKIHRQQSLALAELNENNELLQNNYVNNLTSSTQANLSLDSDDIDPCSCFLGSTENQVEINSSAIAGISDISSCSTNTFTAKNPKGSANEQSSMSNNCDYLSLQQDPSHHIEVSKTSHGTSIELNYLLKPGHLISIQAAQNKLNSKPIIHLCAEAQEDRDQLIIEKEGIEADSKVELIII